MCRLLVGKSCNLCSVPYIAATGKFANVTSLLFFGPESNIFWRARGHKVLTHKLEIDAAHNRWQRKASF